LVGEKSCTFFVEAQKRGKGKKRPVSESLGK